MHNSSPSPLPPYLSIRTTALYCSHAHSSFSRLFFLVLVVLVVVVAILPEPVSGHGRLIEPPSRATAWRYGFNTPHNYNDHELYCGGFSRQWQRNGGKCGVCGDAWDLKTPRPHEFGGVYGKGIIVRNYNAGQTITIRVELTANHFGHFEFSVCPNYRRATQQCLDKHLLEAQRPQDEHNAHRFFPREGNKIYEIRYRLPKRFSCAHCLLQWRYVAGNNWGNCTNGTGAVGCGPQEEFRACADVAIRQTTSGSEAPEEVDEAVDEEYNEVVEDDNIIQSEKPPEKPAVGYSPLNSLFIAFASFLAISLALFLIYFHFYRIGSKVKEWISELKFDFKVPLHKKTLRPRTEVPERRVRTGLTSQDIVYMHNKDSSTDSQVC